MILLRIVRDIMDTMEGIYCIMVRIGILLLRIYGIVLCG